MEKIFSKFGQLSLCGITKDKNEENVRKGIVIFEKKEDAKKCVKTFNDDNSEDSTHLTLNL